MGLEQARMLRRQRGGGGGGRVLKGVSHGAKQESVEKASETQEMEKERSEHGGRGGWSCIKSRAGAGQATTHSSRQHIRAQIGRAHV